MPARCGDQLLAPRGRAAKRGSRGAPESRFHQVARVAPGLSKPWHLVTSVATRSSSPCVCGSPGAPGRVGIQRDLRAGHLQLGDDAAATAPWERQHPAFMPQNDAVHQVDGLAVASFGLPTHTLYITIRSCMFRRHARW